MSIDQTYWTLWAGPLSSTGIYDMTEGKTPAETGLSDSATVNITADTSYKTLVTYNLPSMPGGLLKAGTYEVILRGPWFGTAMVTGLVQCTLTNGTNTFTSDEVAIGESSSETDRTCTCVVSGDVTGTFTLVVKTKLDSSTALAYLRPIHASVRFGMQTGSTGTPRTAFGIIAVAPPVGSHAAPSMIATATPSFTSDCSGVYPDDHLTLVKSADALRTAAHSASDATTQAVGDADDYTVSWPSPTTRRITVVADATRKADTVNNTYYVFTVKSAVDTAIGMLAFETLLEVQAARLTTLNGATSGAYALVDDVAPYLHWVDPNSTTTHWRAKVYRASDDTEMWDSTEQTAGETRVQIPAAAGLSSLTTYYAIVTLMNGSGGSVWTIASAAGYFQIDASATGVKLTSHAGTSAVPEVITDTTPALTWAFERTQHSFNVTIVDEADDSVAYSTGWTASATKGHTVGSALASGHTYSVQVQVKDAIQQHVFTADQRAYIHLQDAAVAAPSLTAEADTDHLTPVTLAWTAPATTDGDALTYEVEVIAAAVSSSANARSAKATAFDGWIAGSTPKWRAGLVWGDDAAAGTTAGATRTYNASSATSLSVGYLPIGTYTWRARATDAHGMVGEWSSTDEFVVADGGVVPVVTLIPWPSNVAPLTTTWTYYDQDGDAQSKYQVQLASDAEFASVVEDSGEVASTALYYQHTTTAAGTYCRRVRVYAGSSWSDWDDDTVTLVGPTTQTSELEIYLDAEGTPTALDQDTYPVSGVKIVFGVNAPAEATFTVNNFDALEGGIDDDEELLVYLKDSAGKRIAFRGAVVSKDVGDMLTVTCRDIGRLFDRWRVTKTLSYLSLGSLVKSIVEDPTGHTATGITAHCEEIPTDTGVVTIASFVGAAKTLSAWLADFAAATGYAWKITYQDSGWHFWWFDPATQPTYAVTLKDNIDRADNSATQWRIGDEVRVTKDRSQYANRVVFSGIPDPPPVPGNGADFDQIFSETTTGWTAIGDATLGAGSTYKVRGANSVSLALAEAHPYRDYIPLAYVRVPAELQDMTQGKSYGYLRADIRMTIGGSAPFTGSFFGDQAGIDAAELGTYYEYIKPNLRPLLYVFTSEGAIAAAADIGPMTRWATDLSSTCIDSTPNPKWAGKYDKAAFAAAGEFATWSWMLPGLGAMGPGDIDMSAYKHVIALGFGLNLDRVYNTSEVFCNWFYSDTRDLVICFQVDNIRIDPYEVGTAPIEMYVETAAVTAGTEAPIEVPLGVTDLNVSSARSLSDLMLTTRNRTRLTVSSVNLDGMRNVPLGSQVPLALPNHGLASATKSLYEINYLPLDSGDRTELGLGDPQQDVARTLTSVRQKLDALVGGTL